MCPIIEAKEIKICSYYKWYMKIKRQLFAYVCRRMGIVFDGWSTRDLWATLKSRCTPSCSWHTNGVQCLLVPGWAHSSSVRKGRACAGRDCNSFKVDSPLLSKRPLLASPLSSLVVGPPFLFPLQLKQPSSTLICAPFSSPSNHLLRA